MLVDHVELDSFNPAFHLVVIVLLTQKQGRTSRLFRQGPDCLLCIIYSSSSGWWPLLPTSDHAVIYGPPQLRLEFPDGMCSTNHSSVGNLGWELVIVVLIISILSFSRIFWLLKQQQTVWFSATCCISWCWRFGMPRVFFWRFYLFPQWHLVRWWFRRYCMYTIQ